MNRTDEKIESANIEQNSILCKMQSEQNSITINKKRRFGIGVIFAIFLVGIGLFAFIGHENLSKSLNRSRRSTVVEMEYSPEDRSEIEDSTDTVPDGPLSPLEPGLPSNAVLRHHAVHTEVNTRINLQDFMRAAAEKAAAMRSSSTSTSGTSADNDDTTPNDEFNIQESEDEELPDFDVCPIMPELPGESGSIRKVREIERQNVQRRVSGNLSILYFLVFMVLLHFFTQIFIPSRSAFWIF